MKTIFVLCVVAFTAVAAHIGDEGRQKRMYPTRCYPGAHCFPDQEEMELFKDSLDGTVTVPSDPDYFSKVASVNLRWVRSPGLVVTAQSVSDVQKAVLFSRHFYLNLVYSGSGMDYNGKGNYDGSMRLDLSQLNAVTSTDLNNNLITGQVTAQVGATWNQVYSVIESTGFPRVVGGGTPSLDTIDTFTNTGGLGYLSRSLGLAADQLVSADVILANGNRAIVSAAGVTVTNQQGEVKTDVDTELFNAIRGGGVTYAVPISFTFQMTSAPGQYASLTGTYKVVDDGAVVGRATLRNILSNMASLPFQWGGYVSIDGTPSTSFPNDRGEIRFHLFSYGQYIFSTNNQNNNFNFNQNVENLRNIVNRQGTTPTTNTLSSLSQYRSDVAEAEQHFTGKQNSYVMNVLVPADTINNSTKLDSLVDLMMEVVNAPTADSNWRCVAKLAGGKVASPNSVNYVNAWMRQALFSWTCALTWDEGITREDYFIAQALEFQNRLRALGMGVDPYYASEDLADWRTALYGTNYYKLLEVKKKWDVDNFLWAHNAVASDWELNCRGIRCPHHH